MPLLVVSGIAIFAIFIAIISGLVFGLHSLGSLLLQINQFLISMVINYLGYAPYSCAVVIPLACTGTIQYTLSNIYIPLFPFLAILLTLLAIYIFAIILFLTRLTWFIY